MRIGRSEMDLLITHHHNHYNCIVITIIRIIEAKVVSVTKKCSVCKHS